MLYAARIDQLANSNEPAINIEISNSDKSVLCDSHRPPIPRNQPNFTLSKTMHLRKRSVREI